MGAFYKNVGGAAVKFGDADAGGISYDNSESGMQSVEVRSALDELVRKLSDGSVRRVGTADVGSTVRPMYLKAGVPVAMTGNVGSATKPVYMANGQVTASASTIGSATQPMWLNKGVMTKTAYTLGKSVPSNAVFTDTVYTHPTTAGNKHVPSGGSSGKFLGYGGSSGVASWQAIPKYSLATQSADGLMSAADKKKLDNFSATGIVTADYISAVGGLSVGSKYYINQSYWAWLFCFPDSNTAYFVYFGGCYSPGTRGTALNLWSNAKGVVRNNSGALASKIALLNMSYSSGMWHINGDSKYHKMIKDLSFVRSFGTSWDVVPHVNGTDNGQYCTACFSMNLNGVKKNGTTLLG